LRESKNQPSHDKMQSNLQSPFPLKKEKPPPICTGKSTT